MPTSTMPPSDLYIFEHALGWFDEDMRVALVTVVETWGSSPRPKGSVLAVCEDGRFCGSVSGGCIEEHIVAHLDRSFPDAPYLTAYGVSAEEAQRFGLPCGGSMQILVEPVRSRESLSMVVSELRARRRVVRTLDVSSGVAQVTMATPGDEFGFDTRSLHTVYGPQWRLILVGAGHLARYLARMALMLDFVVFVTDSRLEYRAQWDVPETTLLTGMPDDAILALGVDENTAILTTAHDPKVDDMALLEVLKSNAFYIGSLGSPRTSAKRRIRLALFDLTPEQIDRLHAPAGLPIGSHLPAEIALSMMAEVIAVRNGVSVVPQADPEPESSSRTACSGG